MSTAVNMAVTDPASQPKATIPSFSDWCNRKVFVYDSYFRQKALTATQDSLSETEAKRYVNAWLISFKARAIYLIDVIASVLLVSIGMLVLVAKLAEAVYKWNIVPAEESFKYLISRVDQALISMVGVLAPSIAQKIDGTHASIFILMALILSIPDGVSYSSSGVVTYYWGRFGL